MRCLLIAATLLLSPAGAWAQSCETLWAARNLVLDAAGQCFNSALGQAVFENEGCSTAQISAAEGEMIAWIQTQEAARGCAIDTSTANAAARILTVLDRHRGLSAIPFASDREVGCLGYSGPPLPARSGMRRDAPVIVNLPRGSTFSSTHEVFGDWQFIQLFDSDGAPSLFGWVEGLRIGPDVCDGLAG